MSSENADHAAFDALRDDLLAAIRSGKRLRPRVVLPKLEAVFSSEWEDDWLRLSIYFNCAGRSRPAKTYAQLIRLREMSQEQGRDEQFETFFAELNELMFPESLTFHGYCSTFAVQDTDQMSRTVGTVLKPLEAFDYPFFLYAGALLGLVRDGQYIAHDDDIDLAVYLGECTDEEAAGKWQRYKEDLCAAGLVAYGPTSNNPPVFKVQNDQNVTVDLFPSWTTETRFSVYPYSYHAMDSADILPLKSDLQRTQNMFGDYEILLPSKPEKLLISSYGANWPVPDPLFRFNWRRAQRQFNILFNQSYC